MADGDSYEARLEKSCAQVNRMAADMRAFLRLTAPTVRPVSDRHAAFVIDRSASTALYRCRICDPDPEVFECPMCGFTTGEKWRYQMHNRWPPEWCVETMAQRARKSSEDYRGDYVRYVSTKEPTPG